MCSSDLMPSPIANAALTDLLGTLSASGFRFTTVTPATHARWLERNGMRQARDLRDVLGWNLPFGADLLPTPLLAIMREAEVIDEANGLLKSRIRVSSIGSRLFLHSAFPTDSADAVFFGPDTYRFVRFVAAELAAPGPVRRLVDIGSGSGAGGLMASTFVPAARITLTDINPEAIRLAAANAAHAGIAIEQIEGSGLDRVDGAIDLILANPPFVMDADNRTYRDGGAMLGAELSLNWTLEGARRLEPGGRMLLYTGVAIVDGRDSLLEALETRLPSLGCSLRYEEIDPDIFGDELDQPGYAQVERIAAIGAVIERR